MVGERFMNSFELRETISMKENRIQSLEQELQDLKRKFNKVSDWNIRWQKERWNVELANECIRDFFKFSVRSDTQDKFTDHEIVILGYLCSLSPKNMKAVRHVGGIARVTGINRGTCSVVLKSLQRKDLIYGKVRGNKKKYYTLPVAKKLIDEARNYGKKKTTDSLSAEMPTDKQ